jgi:hypothetical protein
MDDDLGPNRQQIDAVLLGALDQPSSERMAFVERACGEDRDLFDAVRRLLDYAEAPNAELDTGGGLSGAIWAELGTSFAEDTTPPDDIGAYRVAREMLASGRSDEALAQYREALHIAEASYSAVPSDLLALWRHARSLERLGDFLRRARRGRRQRAAGELGGGTGLV